MATAQYMSLLNGHISQKKTNVETLHVCQNVGHVACKMQIY